MKLKTLASTIALGFGLVGGLAHAAPIALPGGPIYVQFNNLEQVDLSLTNSIAVPGGAIDVTGDGIPDTPASEGNWGVVNVSSLQKGAVTVPHNLISGGPAFFVDDGPSGIFGQGQVTGIFYGITTTSGTTATGGYLDLRWEDNGADDITAAILAGGAPGPGARTAANAAGIWTDGTLLARLKFMPGVVANDLVTTIKSTVDITTTFITGTADSFADVIDINNDGVIDALDGAWAKALNTDYFFVELDGGAFDPGSSAGELRDLRFSNRFFFPAFTSWDGPAGSGIKGLQSNDPVMAFAVPEPSTLALSGIFLLALALGFGRRKHS